MNRGGTVEPDALYNRALIERKVLMEAYQRHFIYDLVEVTEVARTGSFPPLQHHTAGVTLVCRNP